MPVQKYTYLDKIDSPDDLKKLSADALQPFADELREFIIEQLASNPGHLGSSLGVVELTTALHYIFDSPEDKIIWDVGHQAYAHKIITGRRDRFHTNRKLNGISGFPKISESEHDAFGGGHSSVSISAAFGMATANILSGKDSKVVAVIGDGALTGGLAFEGLNNAGVSNSDLLVILNDNNMSIDQNVGALKEYLLDITTSQQYNKIKNKAWRSLSAVPGLRRMIQKTGNAIKQGLLQQSNLFESLNFRYFGPVDGHDIRTLTKVLKQLRDIPGPKLLHVITVKGKGYKPAQQDQTAWHAPGKFDPTTGERLNTSSQSQPALYQEVFGHTLTELAAQDKRIVGITPAMPSGCSMNIMMKEMPERCFDVGIAEGHAVTFSAGLAAGGMIPFCNIYSSFMQRAYDNVIHDVALQELGVVLCLDRAGIVGEDGATHHGLFDISYFNPIPGIIISSPMNEAELRNLMYTAKESGKPFVIRYPRGRGEGVAWNSDFERIDIGKGRVISDGNDIAVLSLGPLGNRAKSAIDKAQEEGYSIYHADMRFAKPLDEEILHSVGKRFGSIITIEDGVLEGGMGSAIVSFMNRHNYDTHVNMLGVDDRFVEHGTQEELYSLCGLDEESIHQTIISTIANK